MNNEEDEFKRIEREALRRAASEFALPQLRTFLGSLKDRIARRYQGSLQDKDVAYGMEIVYFDLVILIEGKK